MLKLILIDDEEPALDWLDYLLREEPRVAVAGRYADPRQALAHLHEWDADAVLIDIEMPGMNGLEAAETIGSARPDIGIVFVTAYNQYAIQAFELSAVDYLVKPVSAERLGRTVDRLRSGTRRTGAAPRADGQTAIPAPRVQMLGFFEMRASADPGTAVKWRTAKERELAAYLLHHRNRGVGRQKILEEVWAGFPLEQASPFLHTSVSNIRKRLALFGDRCSLVFQNGSYLLRADGLSFDTDRLERACRLPEPMDDGAAAELEASLRQSAADYLGEEGYHWAAEEQARFQRMLLEAGKRVGAYYLGTKRYALAENVYRLLLRLNPYDDDVNERMLVVLAGLGDRAAMKRHYESFALLLRQELGIDPQPDTSALYRRLLGGERPA